MLMTHKDCKPYYSLSEVITELLSSHSCVPGCQVRKFYLLWNMEEQKTQIAGQGESANS